MPTFSEARLFLQNAGRRLSAQESQNLPPVGRKYLAQFASSLDEAIQSTAQYAGVLDEYNAAIKEYRQGMGLNNVWESGKSMRKGMAEKAIQNACASPKSRMRELGFAATTFRGWELA